MRLAGKSARVAPQQGAKPQQGPPRFLAWSGMGCGASQTAYVPPPPEQFDEWEWCGVEKVRRERELPRGSKLSRSDAVGEESAGAEQPETPAAKHTRRHATAERDAKSRSYRRRSTTGFEAPRRSRERVTLGRVTGGRAKVSRQPTRRRSSEGPRRERARSDVELAARRKIRGAHQLEIAPISTHNKSLGRRSNRSSTAHRSGKTSVADSDDSGGVRPEWRYAYPATACDSSSTTAGRSESNHSRRRHSSVDLDYTSAQPRTQLADAESSGSDAEIEATDSGSPESSSSSRRRRRHSSVEPAGRRRLPPLQEKGAERADRGGHYHTVSCGDSSSSMLLNAKPLENGDESFTKTATVVAAYRQYRSVASGHGSWTDGRGSWRKLHADLRAVH